MVQVRGSLSTVRALLLTVAILLIAACTTPAGTFCTIAKPQRLSQATVATMTDAEVEAALAHNEKGAALCQWKP